MTDVHPLTETAAPDRLTAIEAVEGLIANGGYRPGDRLPPEREMIVSLGMSRNTLRRALEVMEAKGAIWRHVGKGTFVARQNDATTMKDLTQQVSPVQMMRARLSLEPALSREAALHATQEDVARLYEALRGAEDAQDWAVYEAQDDAFHRRIAEATGNVLLLALFDQLNQVHRAVAWNSVVRGTARPSRDHSSFAEHRAIAEAIAVRDPQAAHTAMRAHLGSVSGRLFREE